MEKRLSSDIWRCALYSSNFTPEPMEARLRFKHDFLARTATPSSEQIRHFMFISKMNLQFNSITAFGTPPTIIHRTGTGKRRVGSRKETIFNFDIHESTILHFDLSQKAEKR
jgi:hypothetical protein